MTWTVADVLSRLPKPADPCRLPAPAYRQNPHTIPTPGVGCFVPSMERHMTDEGFQIFEGLEHSGYVLTGDRRGFGTDMDHILSYFPTTLLLQDKREYEGRTAGKGFDDRERFTNVSAMKPRNDVFKGTVLKDAQNDPHYHADSANEIGCHFWVVYYSPEIVAHVAPYVRKEHLVRTYHTVDPAVVPDYTVRSGGTILSGALGSAYPLRTALAKYAGSGSRPKGFDVLRHPGYGRDGCKTPAYLSTLARYRVSVCTASKYGYLLRKIIESTAAGCVVVTDLPADEVVPEIDGNLIRIRPDVRPGDAAELCRGLVAGYNPGRQEDFARKAVARFDYRVEGVRLAGEIESLRVRYNCREFPRV